MEKEIKRLLVIRFSAMGDVAMTAPVISLLAKQHPHLRITVLTRKRFVPMFEWTPANVEVKGIDLESYSGVGGLTKLFYELQKRDFDAVADLHDVLRTKYLRTCFRMAGKKVAVIDKGRKEKKQLVKNTSDGNTLKRTYERYADTFKELGLALELQPFAFDLSKENLMPLQTKFGRKQEGERWIGIAPFAAHETKVYPLEKMHQVADTLAELGCKVFLFGAGKKECDVLDDWQNEGIVNVCGKLNGLHQEMLLISKLDTMVSMDSANMHIAAMLGTRVVSIWGSTHPSAGFNGWGLDDDSIVQVDSLQCRPCSIYGNKPCKLGDHRCMNMITPEDIVNKVVNKPVDKC